LHKRKNDECVKKRDHSFNYYAKTIDMSSAFYYSMIMIQNKYTIPYTVPSSAIDGACRVTPAALLGFAQDLASSHYGTGGLSIPHMQKRGMTWVVTKQHFEIEEYPLWLDELELTTWAKAPKGLICIRDFSYSYAPNGKKATLDDALGTGRSVEGAPSFVQRESPFLRGTSSWMVLDGNTGKPIKPAPELFGTLPFCEEDAVPALSAPAFPRFSFPASGSKSAAIMTENQFSPAITDIDLNGHVNNLHYVRWILSYMPEDIFQSRKISILDTYFIASAMLGDFLVCKTAVMAPFGDREKSGEGVECVHSIVRETDGVELFRARTIWKNAAQLSREVCVS
jgi:acyl-ACP thioesterase